MSDLRNLSEFITFVRNAIKNEFTQEDMALSLNFGDFCTLEQAIIDFFSEDVIQKGEDTAYILDDLHDVAYKYLGAIGMDIITPNIHNENYDLIETPGVTNPLENVRRSLVSLGASDVVDFVRTKLENATGRDPYNDSWFLS